MSFMTGQGAAKRALQNADTVAHSETDGLVDPYRLRISQLEAQLREREDTLRKTEVLCNKYFDEMHVWADKHRERERAHNEALDALQATAKDAIRFQDQLTDAHATIARLEGERDSLALEIEGWKQKNRKDNEYLLAQWRGAEATNAILDDELQRLRNLLDSVW